MGVPQKPSLRMDSTADFSAGVNTDPPPIALPKNQLSFGTNGTMRDSYWKPRPAFRDMTLTFDPGIQDQFEQFLFQGACFYQPDYGAESFIASIGGKLFQVTPGIDSAHVTDITPSDGGNSQSVGTVWLWQGENFVFANDGGSQTIVFNGSSTRRADPGSLVATVSSPATIGALGVPIAVSTTPSLEIASGTAVDVYSSSSKNFKIGQFQYSTSTTGQQLATLTNQNDTPGTLHTADTDVIIAPSNILITTQPIVNNSTTIVITGRLVGSAPAIGSTIRIEGFNPSFTFTVIVPTGGTPSNYTIYALRNQGAIPVTGDVVVQVGGPANVTIGQVGAFTAPAVGASVVVPVDITAAFQDGDTVYIDGARYTIAAADSSSVSAVYLTPISLNQTTGTIPAGAVIYTLPELPPGRMGVYGLGRNWISLPDGKSYLASDIVGGSSGSLAAQFRDAILNVTENNFLAGGGVFRVPSAGQTISAMQFPATLDSSLGQGPLQVLTQLTTFSCNAPVQRSEWQVMSNPIQTQSLVGGGALSHYGTVAVNGDLWFRSYDGIRSLKLARQDFLVSYGNTPQSIEMNRVLQADNRNLLNFCSGINFDNRLLMTCRPVQGPRGVYHTGIIALNNDPNSNLREKKAPIYDGLWEGRNILQLVTGSFSGVSRAFAFVYHADTQKIGFTELLTTADTIVDDNDSDPIVSSYESPALFYQEETATRNLLRLDDGEIIVSNLRGTVRFDIYYRPDYDTQWHSWHSWQVSDAPSWQPRMGLGSPDYKQGDPATGRPYAVGYSFQVKVVITGYCQVLGMNFFAVTEQETTRAKPLPRLTPLPI